MKASVAIDPEKNTSLLKHYEGWNKYSDKLKYALHLKLIKTGNFMTDSETRSSACVERSGFDSGWMDDSTVANKLGMFLCVPLTRPTKRGWLTH